MIRTCLILNGPPGSGKDTLADILAGMGYHKHMMKETLYIDTANFFNVDVEELTVHATDRDLKEDPWHKLLLPSKSTYGVVSVRMLSPREALIHVSEKIIKPNEGLDYFGRAAAKRCIERKSDLAVFSDGGFAAEIPPIQAIYDKTLILRLRREGFDYAGDSRSYLEGFENTYDVHLVPGQPDKAVEDIKDIIYGRPDEIFNAA
tara:strand:+ start:1882 stop:2493 length:612 start_codon:yes stop_codon:yes gene_type:complete